MDKYHLAIILTTIGFFALAALLLVPVWRFLNREEQISREWTEDALRQGHRDVPSGNGVATENQANRRPDPP